MERSMAMKAVGATAFGGPEVLSVINMPARQPHPGEVLIEVRAAGTNPVDYKQYSGMMGHNPDNLPIHPGREVAGVVTEVADSAAAPGRANRTRDEGAGV